VKQPAEIFDFDDYKAYLLWREQNWDGRGMRQALAKAMGCQPAHVSQILNGDERDFTPEQALNAHELLTHSELEGDYFIAMIQVARSGTVTLKEYYQRQMAKIRRDQLEMSRRVAARQTLQPEDQSRYYSHPYYALVHVALTIPALRTTAALSQRLALPESFVIEILDFLTQTGLAAKDEATGSYKVGQNRLHLDRSTSMILSHHRNWRNKVIDELTVSRPDDLHYTSVMSLSKADFVVVREYLAQAIEHISKKIIPPSPEEELAVLTMDFFTYKK
jgi:uncharacterized protein (TIGR02147 family)